MKIKSFTFALVSVAALGLLAFTTPAPVSFTVDSKSSTLVWKGKKVTGEHTGTVQVSAGELTVDGKTIKKGSFEIDLTTITNTDLTDKGYNEKLVGHLKSDDFFGVAKFPKASFVVGSVTAKSGNEYTVNGKLTIKGKTNEIEFPATILVEGKQVTASAKIVVDRAKYDIRYGSKSFFDNLGDKVIYDDFELDLKLVATAK